MDGRFVDDIATFVAVVDANGFAAGGRALGLSRSAAGKAVARLEARLGARLLNRSTRSLSLTDDGHGLYRQGMALAEALDQMEASLVRNVTVPQGVLRLTAPDAFGRKAVLPVVSAFLERWPDVQVEIGFSDTVVSMIDEGFDLAIRIGVTSPSPGLIMRVLRKENVLLCAAPAYLDRRGRPEGVDQLDGHDLLFHARHNERQNWMLRQPDGSVGAVRGRSRLRLDSASAIQDAAIAGMGIALLPGSLVETDIARGTLCHLLPEATPEPVPIVALYPHRRHLDGKVRHFIDDLAASLQEQS